MARCQTCKDTGSTTCTACKGRKRGLDGKTCATCSGSGRIACDCPAGRGASPI